MQLQDVDVPTQEKAVKIFAIPTALLKAKPYLFSLFSKFCGMTDYQLRVKVPKKQELDVIKTLIKNFRHE